MESLLTLAIVLFGLAILLGGGKVFAGLADSAGGCLARIAILLALLAVGYWFVADRFPQGSSPAPGSGSSPAGAPSQPPASPPLPPASPAAVHLQQYPALSQLDPANYRQAGFEGILDTAPGGALLPVAKMACLAANYAMLARGRGNAGATIDDFYPDPNLYGNNSPGPVSPGYVGAEQALDLDAVVRDLDAGRPAILRGVGGPLKQHYILATGYGKDSTGRVAFLIANDPWPQTGDLAPGRQIRIDLSGNRPVHPVFGFAFTDMRRTTF